LGSTVLEKLSVSTVTVPGWAKVFIHQKYLLVLFGASFFCSLSKTLWKVLSVKN